MSTTYSPFCDSNWSILLCCCRWMWMVYIWRMTEIQPFSQMKRDASPPVCLEHTMKCRVLFLRVQTMQVISSNLQVPSHFNSCSDQSQDQLQLPQRWHQHSVVHQLVPKLSRGEYCRWNIGPILCFCFLVVPWAPVNVHLSSVQIAFVLILCYWHCQYCVNIHFWHAYCVCFVNVTNFTMSWCHWCQLTCHVNAVELFIWSRQLERPSTQFRPFTWGWRTLMLMCPRSRYALRNSLTPERPWS